MPAVTPFRAAATAITSQHVSNTSPLLAPSVVAAFAAYWYKGELADGCKKITGASKSLSSSSIVACESNLPALPTLSISRSSRFGSHQPLHACSSTENTLSHLSPASSSIFGDLEGLLDSIPWSHNEITGLVHHDILLLCLHWDSEEQRFSSLLQVPSDDGNATGNSPADPAVHKQFLSSHTLQWQVRDVLLGRSGIFLSYITILLQCVRFALAGDYAHLSFVSDAAYVHTLFNIGGYHRPF
ncbi:hypothetical protein OIU76_015916 [Salix suchowensis]|nr:hypothetical protein OIU76_015916 [Salix suchowensis]